ncbi:MAG: hypothetical protein JWN13_672 [Betaproteobacteria bacterium]|nr:hypothetical protein [Betaproteobacteria bacterium]
MPRTSQPPVQTRSRAANPPHCFTIIELLVVIAIIAVLAAILIPAAEKIRESAMKSNCANNLRQVGQALGIYSNENHGEYPRTSYVPDAPLTAGTNPAAPDPFRVGGPLANDITAPLFLLVRAKAVLPKMLICPYTDVNRFEEEPAADVASRSNFTDYRKNLGYSYANPYPDSAASAKGYRLHNRLGSEFAVAADLNPGLKDDNSKNHEDEGQNVLYADGHVQWQQSPKCGIGTDNIYRSNDGALGSPINVADSVLLPAQN